MSIVSGSPPSAPASMGGLSSAVEDVSTGMSSLRFDGASYLSRTPATDSGDDYIKGRKFTLSFWIKISNISANQSIFCGSLARPTFDIALLYDSGKPRIVTNVYNGSGYDLYGEAVSNLRDTSAWYHLHFEMNTTESSSSDRYKIYVNSNLQTLFSSGGPSLKYPNLNHRFDVATANLQRVFGGFSFGSVYPQFKGYMADIHFIDGEALTPEATGELVSDVWRPKKYSGDYGVNGFHLDFHADNMVYDVNGQLTTVMDASGNDNHWTAN